MKKKGLTMLEILIAMLILGIIVTGLANVFVASKKLVLHSRNRIFAVEAAKYMLAPLSAGISYSSWGSTNCLLNAAGCDTSPPNVARPSGIIFYPSWSVIDPGDPAVRKVKLTMSWNEPVQ